tara:strand:- start:446 stop:631 length:186 start_codon:yes stop_codon:yes gene_type:complete
MSTEYYTHNPEARVKHNEYCKLKAKERYQNDPEYREKQRLKSRARGAAKKMLKVVPGRVPE